MKLTKARNLYLICILAVAVFVGGMSSCKNDKKDSRGQIDKNAVAQIGFYETYKYPDIAQDISNLSETAGKPTLSQIMVIMMALPYAQPRKVTPQQSMLSLPNMVPEFCHPTSN